MSTACCPIPAATAPRHHLASPTQMKSWCTASGQKVRHRTVATAGAASRQGDAAAPARYGDATIDERSHYDPFVKAAAVFWDVDGTLADSTQLGFTSTNAVLLEAGRADCWLIVHSAHSPHPLPQGTLVHYERTVRERLAMPGRRMRRVCERRTGTLVHDEQIARERVARPCLPASGPSRWRTTTWARGTPRLSA